MNTVKFVRLRSFIHLFFILNLIGSNGMLVLAKPVQRLAQATSPRASAPTVSQSLRFEPNLGQADSSVRYLTQGPGYSAFFTGTEIVWALQKPGGASQPSHSEDLSSMMDQALGVAEIPSIEFARLRMKLANSEAEPVFVPQQPLPGKSNYFKGNNPDQWHRNVPGFGQLHITGVYPGIDMVVYGNERQLEYDFVLSPGARPEQIKLEFDETSEPVRVDADGNLVLTAGGVSVSQKHPTLYQEINGERKVVEGRFSIVSDTQVGFEVPAYDPAYPLIIDPVVSVESSTYVGGSGNDSFSGVVTDANRNLYLCGFSASANFPVQSAFQSDLKGPTDVTVLKLDPAGELVYATYLGGQGGDTSGDLTVDDEGNVYLTGVTSSTDFPVVNPAQRFSGGGNDVFVAKLNPEGNELVFSTYLGGPVNGTSNQEQGTSIAVDQSGAVYVTGITSSTGFPTVNPFQSKLGGSSNFSDAFVTKLSSNGSQIVFSTYLGGRGNTSENGLGIAPDSAGNVYVYGLTFNFRLSSLVIDFPVTSNAFQREFGGGGSDLFVSKLNPSGNQLLYSSYLGGSEDENATCTVGSCSNLLTKKQVVVDEAGNFVIAGFTTSPNYPVRNPIQGTFGGSVDAVVTQINPDGSEIVFSTFLGGSGSDFGSGVTVGSTGDLYVTGVTFSTNFPTVNPTQAAFAGPADVFVTQMNRNQGKLVFSTYLGGKENDQPTEIFVDQADKIHVVGFTTSPDFPVQNAIQDKFSGGQDAFLTTFAEVEATPDFTLIASPATQVLAAGETKSVEVALQGMNGFNQSVTLSTTTTPATSELKPALSVASALPGAPIRLTLNATAAAQPGSYEVTVTGTARNLERKAVVTVTVAQAADTQSPTVTVNNPMEGAQFESRPNTQIQVSWQSTDDRGVVSHAVELKGQRNGTAFQDMVATGLPGTASSFTLTIAENDAFLQGQVIVSATDAARNTGTGQSGIFSVTAPPPPDTQSPAVSQVTLSKTSIKRKKDPSLTISWTSSDNVAVESHDVLYATDGVTFDTTVASGLAGTLQQFTWTVPSTLPKTRQGRIKVTAKDQAGNQGEAMSESLKIK